MNGRRLGSWSGVSAVKVAMAIEVHEELVEGIVFYSYAAFFCTKWLHSSILKQWSLQTMKGSSFICSALCAGSMDTHTF